jgi:hypothetical protein
VRDARDTFAFVARVAIALISVYLLTETVSWARRWPLFDTTDGILLVAALGVLGLLALLARRLADRLAWPATSRVHVSDPAAPVLALRAVAFVDLATLVFPLRMFVEAALHVEPWRAWGWVVLPTVPRIAVAAVLLTKAHSIVPFALRRGRGTAEPPPGDVCTAVALAGAAWEVLRTFESLALLAGWAAEYVGRGIPPHPDGAVMAWLLGLRENTPWPDVLIHGSAAVLLWLAARRSVAPIPSVSAI